jgi:hypothetical protein
MPAAKKKRKKAVQRTDPKQSSRFLETAKKLEVDESGEAFERAVAAVTKTPASQQKKTKQ